MKTKSLISSALPIFLGVVAAIWTPLSFWVEMKEGLIAFLGFLAASLVQVMPLTANFLQSDDLTPEEANRLNQSLTKQQYYWMGLLSATIAAMVIVIVGSALAQGVKDIAPLFKHPLFIDFGWSAVVCFFVSSSVCFVLVKMLGLFEGMMSLHRLRGELVINSAKRKAAAKAKSIQQAALPRSSVVPENYGSVIPPAAPLKH